MSLQYDQMKENMSTSAEVPEIKIDIEAERKKRRKENQQKMDQYLVDNDMQYCSYKFPCMSLILLFIVTAGVICGAFVPRTLFNNKIKQSTATVFNATRLTDESIYFAYTSPLTLGSNSVTFQCQRIDSRKYSSTDGDCLTLQAELVNKISNKITIFYNKDDLNGDFVLPQDVRFYYTLEKSMRTTMIVLFILSGMFAVYITCFLCCCCNNRAVVKELKRTGHKAKLAYWCC